VTTINFAAREINCKIVYYGPGLSGKTTNLKQIYQRVAPEVKGEMVSLATEDERTLFFDFLPIDLGTVKGFKTRFHLYTVPGQTFYNASRKLILRGADGIIFVADSAPDRQEANRESWLNLIDNLREHAMRIGDVPLVIQVNKRDLPNAVPVDRVLGLIDPERRYHHFEGAAAQGRGIFDPLRAVSRLVLQNIAKTR